MTDRSTTDLAADLVTAAREGCVILTTAESCTGGLIAGAITDIPGSSDVFQRGFVTYSNDAKQDLLNVSAQSLARFGAVSEAVAKEMAYGALAAGPSDYSVAVTGIAGPGGGSSDKPVGLVWMGVCRAGTAPEARKFEFGDLGRTGIRQATVREALRALFEMVRTA